MLGPNVNFNEAGRPPVPGALRGGTWATALNRDDGAASLPFVAVSCRALGKAGPLDTATGGVGGAVIRRRRDCGSPASGVWTAPEPVPRRAASTWSAAACLGARASHRSATLPPPVSPCRVKPCHTAASRPEGAGAGRGGATVDVCAETCSAGSVVALPSSALLPE